MYDIKATVMLIINESFKQSVSSHALTKNLKSKMLGCLKICQHTILDHKIVEEIKCDCTEQKHLTWR